jgi:hypothetical protein
MHLGIMNDMTRDFSKKRRISKKRRTTKASQAMVLNTAEWTRSQLGLLYVTQPSKARRGDKQEWIEATVSAAQEGKRNDLAPVAAQTPSRTAAREAARKQALCRYCTRKIGFTERWRGVRVCLVCDEVTCEACMGGAIAAEPLSDRVSGQPSNCAISTCTSCATAVAAAERAAQWVEAVAKAGEHPYKVFAASLAQVRAELRRGFPRFTAAAERAGSGLATEEELASAHALFSQMRELLQDLEMAKRACDRHLQKATTARDKRLLQNMAASIMESRRSYAPQWRVLLDQLKDAKAVDPEVAAARDARDAGDTEAPEITRVEPLVCARTGGRVVIHGEHFGVHVRVMIGEVMVPPSVVERNADGTRLLVRRTPAMPDDGLFSVTVRNPNGAECVLDSVLLYSEEFGKSEEEERMERSARRSGPASPRDSVRSADGGGSNAGSRVSRRQSRAVQPQQQQQQQQQQPLVDLAITGAYPLQIPTRGGKITMTVEGARDVGSGLAVSIDGRSVTHVVLRDEASGEVRSVRGGAIGLHVWVPRGTDGSAATITVRDRRSEQVSTLPDALLYSALVEELDDVQRDASIPWASTVPDDEGATSTAGASDGGRSRTESLGPGASLADVDAALDDLSASFVQP